MIKNVIINAATMKYFIVEPYILEFNNIAKKQS